MWSEPPSTLVQLVEHFAREKPDDLAFAFLGDGEVVTEEISFSELHDIAVQIAARLRDRVAPGSRVMLVHCAGLDFLKAFFGVAYSGAVAVPVYPPERSRLAVDFARIANIARDCDARLILCDEQFLELGEEIRVI